MLNPASLSIAQNGQYDRQKMSKQKIEDEHFNKFPILLLKIVFNEHDL